MTRYGAILLAFAALAGCEAPTQLGYLGVSEPIATSRAVALYETVCIKNGADLSTARQTLAGLPFVLNPDSDIYVSSEVQVSFKITPVTQFESICSMVWFPIEGSDQSLAALSAIDPTAQVRENDDGTLSAFHYGAP